MTDQEKALEIVREAAAKLEPLWDYVPNRPLGWLDLLVSDAIERLRKE